MTPLEGFLCARVQRGSWVGRRGRCQARSTAGLWVDSLAGPVPGTWAGGSTLLEEMAPKPNSISCPRRGETLPIFLYPQGRAPCSEQHVESGLQWGAGGADVGCSGVWGRLAHSAVGIGGVARRPSLRVAGAVPAHQASPSLVTRLPRLGGSQGPCRVGSLCLQLWPPGDSGRKLLAGCQDSGLETFLVLGGPAGSQSLERVWLRPGWLHGLMGLDGSQGMVTSLPVA